MLLLLLLLLPGGSDSESTTAWTQEMTETSPDEDASNWRPQHRQVKEGHAHHHLTQAMLAHDFGNYSCQSIYQHTDQAFLGENTTTATTATLQCAYARTCNDGDGILLAERVFCQNDSDSTSDSSSWSSFSSMSSPMQQFLILAAPLALVLIVMFRILGSTAEEFFSPGLEMSKGVDF